MDSLDDKRLQRIELKLDDISDHLHAVDVTLGQQHISLKEHMRRTSLLEKATQILLRRMYMVEGAVALLSVTAAIYEIIRATR